MSDIFISYSHQNKEWVRGWLLPHLEAAGLKVLIDFRDFQVGKSSLDNIEEAVEACKHTLLVMTPAYVDSEWGRFENLLTQSDDPAATRGRLLPLMLEDCMPPRRIKMLSWAEFRERENHLTELNRLLGQLGKPPLSAELSTSDDAELEPETVHTDSKIAALFTKKARLEKQLEDCSDDEVAAKDVRIQLLELRREIRQGGGLHPGDILCDRYVLKQLIGSGGFAEVWKAWDRNLLKTVAVKVLHGQFRNDQTLRERFFRGARQMAALKHHAVVPVLETEMEDERFYFFVMKYLSGGNLHERVLAGDLSLVQKLAIIKRVGEALANAHEVGLVHRDVKPQNILLDQEGQAYLTDFDLVKAADTTGGTRTSAGMGTFVYAAPEALDDAKEATSAVDIYGLGMTLLFAIHGKRLGREAVYQRGPLIGDLNCSDSFKQVIRKAVAIDPEERPATINFFINQLKSESYLLLSSVEFELIGEGRVAGERKVLRISDFALPLRWIPPGTFLMGSPEDELGRHHGEAQYRVVLTQGFWLTETQTTQYLWRRVMGKNPSRVYGDHLPVEQVSWEEVQRFLDCLNIFEPGYYRLPTEAEWEYACRAGSTGPYAGDLDKMAWFMKNSGHRTQKVGSKDANAWGLHDMHGNVCEWCADWVGPYPTGVRSNPKGFPGGSDRIVRGGSCDRDESLLRSASRMGCRPTVGDPKIGFRFVLDPNE